MKPTRLLHSHESCEASPRTKREDLGAGISRKEDKMSIRFLTSHESVDSVKGSECQFLSILAS
jgi:hypothetical protein